MYFELNQISFFFSLVELMIGILNSIRSLFFSLVELMIGILSSIRSFLKSKSAQDESERNNSGVEKNKRRKVSEF